MIAPLGQMDAETAETRRRLQLARRLVASTFFRHRREPTKDTPPISALAAWAFTAWVVIVTGIYFATMLGLL